MIKTKVTCDITGKELVGQDMVGMTVVSIQFKHVDQRDITDQVTGKTSKQDFVKQMDNYQFHICHEHAGEFMEMVKKHFKDKGVEGADGI